MEWNRVRRSPALAPFTALAAALVMLAANPGREQVIFSLMGDLREPVRLVPLASDALIPTLFAKCLWSAAILAGWSWMLIDGFRRRLLACGAISLTVYAFSGMVLWTTTLQLWSTAPWFSDAAQGWFLFGFLIAYPWAVIFTLRFWMQDLGQRCPECLDRLCMPLQRGRECDYLGLDPDLGVSEIESVCIHGHGTMSRTRWAHSFRPVTGFWKQLLK